MLLGRKGANPFAVLKPNKYRLCRCYLTRRKGANPFAVLKPSIDLILISLRKAAKGPTLSRY